MHKITIRQLLSDLTEALTPAYGGGEASSIARIVAEDAFHLKGNAGRELDEVEYTRYLDISQRLLSGEPVQYVLGQADFFGMKFRVSPATLIPRQETEELVAWVLEEPVSNGVKLLDVGLGSGCIAISIRKKRPGWTVYGMDVSEEALAVAQQNSETLVGGDTRFFHGNALKKQDWQNLPALDIVISNPPYIPAAERTLVPAHVLNHEPHLALFVTDDDPLLFYREIAGMSLEKLKSGGRIFFECNEFNAGEVAEMLGQSGFTSIESRKDICGADRMVRAVKTDL
ncbi:MAG: peptide chain release factor N(5)-glutamine methyltransferase [Saprospiraceae bacterium]|nr:peptide chain release factor N(5)-glutamine methyltransferase [Saprospiraceae bacterium]